MERGRRKGSSMRPLCPFRMPSILKKKFRGCFVAAKYTFVGEGRFGSEHTYELVVATPEFKTLSEPQQLQKVRAALKEKMILKTTDLDRLDIKTCSTGKELSGMIFGRREDLPSNTTFPLRVVRMMGRPPKDE